MLFVIEMINDYKPDMFSDIKAFNDKIDLIFTIIGIYPRGFLNTEKSHVIQMVAKGITCFPFPLRYVKYDKPPLFVPCGRFWDFDVLAPICKRPLPADFI